MSTVSLAKIAVRRVDVWWIVDTVSLAYELLILTIGYNDRKW